MRHDNSSASTASRCAPQSRNCKTANAVAAAKLWDVEGVVLRPFSAGHPVGKRFTFAPWKRARVWDTDLKDGAYLRQPVSCRLPGTQLNRGNVRDVVARQRTGTVVMQQRELLRHVVRGERSPRAARLESPAIC